MMKQSKSKGLFLSFFQYFLITFFITMDIIEKYCSENTDNKLRVSHLFQSEAKSIGCYNCTLELDETTWRDLEQHWVGLVNEYCNANPDVKIRKDFYLIDFSDLLNECKITISKRDLEADIVEETTSAVARRRKEKAKANLTLSDDKIQIKAMKKTSSLEKDKLSVDILKLGVFDFASKNKTNGTMSVLGKEFEYFKNLYTSHLKKSKRMGELCKSIFMFEKDEQLNATISKAKKYKNNCKENEQDKKNDIKKIINVVKIYKKRNKKDELVSGEYNETEYLFYFIEPFISQVIKSVPHIKLKCGERYLRVAADYDNENLNDEDARSKGPKIDLIFRNMMLNIDIAILEISGPNHKINQVHYLGDRFKIAKNLKIMMESLLSAARYATPIEKRKIKLYGFHIYFNKLIIYSLQKPDDVSYVFTEESNFMIPTSYESLKADLHQFISNLWIIENILSKSSDNIKALLESSGAHTVFTTSSSQSITEDTSSRPLKAQKRS